MFAAWAQKANNYAKVCSVDGSDTAFDTLTNINATSELIFRTNHRLVILNDVVNGNVLESTGIHQGHQNPMEQGGNQTVEATGTEQRQRQQPA